MLCFTIIYLAAIFFNFTDLGCFATRRRKGSLICLPGYTKSKSKLVPYCMFSNFPINKEGSAARSAMYYQISKAPD